MTLEGSLAQASGIARASRIIELGYSRREIARALEAGRVWRPVRGWIALPGADPALVFAAQNNVVLSCVTQAKRLGLWVREDPRCAHVAVRGKGAHVRAAGIVVHWSRPLMLRNPERLEDPVENVLGHVAECQPGESALVIWESAMNARIVDYRRLETLPLRGRARRLLAECRPFADSGLESLMFQRLKWLPVRLRQQAFVVGHRVDLLIGDRLVVQIDGAHHTGAQRTADIAHDAQLMVRGYRVLRFSYEQVMFQWELVEDAVLGAIARGEHLAI